MASNIIHLCPPEGSGLMPCCGRAPFEVPEDRMAFDPQLVTCRGTTAPMTDDKLDLDALRHAHRRINYEDHDFYCNACAVDWPCQTALVLAEVDRLTVERDRARDIAVALEQQTAEIERVARDLYSRYGARGFEAAEAILRVLNPEPDDPPRRCAYCDALAVPGLPNHNGWPVCDDHADDIQRLLGDETETQQ